VTDIRGARAFAGRRRGATDEVPYLHISHVV